jgi:hypothetical protein
VDHLLRGDDRLFTTGKPEAELDGLVYGRLGAVFH